MKVQFRGFTESDQLTIRQAMPFTFSEGTNGIVAYDADTAQTLAVLVAQEWTYTGVTVHQVILKPMVLRHGWFQEIGDWLFHRGRRLVMLAPVPSSNERAIEINRKLGFKELVRIPDAYDNGVDFVVMELRPDHVNPRYWNPELNRQKEAA
jgi:hypothetical protein